MDIIQITSFYYTIKLGSITKAAEFVHRSQPTISQQIKSLEEELGVVLFERKGKQKFFLTPEGRRFLLFAEQCIHLYSNMLHDIKIINSPYSGSLSISAASTTLGLMLADYVELFQKNYPNIKLSLIERSPGVGIELLMEGKIDLAIALESQIPPTVSKTTWDKGYFMLMLPKGHELMSIEKPSLKTLSEYPFIKLASRNRYAATSKLEQAFLEHDLEMKLFLEANNIYLMGEYVRRGLGISMALFKKDKMTLFPGDLDFKPMDHIFPPENISICYRKNFALTAAGRLFLDMLKGDTPHIPL